VQALLTTHRQALDRLAEALLHSESVSQEQLITILGERIAAPQQAPQRAESIAPPQPTPPPVPIKQPGMD
jgi:hypothetical protein